MQAGKQINVQKHEHPINKKSHKLGGTRLGKMDQQEVNFLVSPAESPVVATCEKKQPAKKEMTEESPPCVTYPKGGKGNARSKPGKEWSHDQRCKDRESVMRREGISTHTLP